jgi:RNA polymerase sigma factor (sigma-70 family)
VAESPTTQPSLLVRIRDAQDQDAWRQFVQLYGPVVYAYGRTHGLQDADAADLLQEVLAAVNAAARRLDYDPRRGSFRGWLFTVAHHKLHDLRARRGRHGQGSGDTGVQEWLAAQPAPEEDVAFWNQEYERRLFTWAAEQVRDRFQDATWQAFWQTAVVGKSGQEVAAALGMSVAAVYLAKSRVMARLREQIQQWEGSESHGPRGDS